MMTESIKPEKNSLHETVVMSVNNYLDELGTKESTNLHRMFLDEVEEAMLGVVIKEAKYNQSKAGKMLGVSRGTCRNMLLKYFGDKYCKLKD